MARSFNKLTGAESFSPPSSSYSLCQFLASYPNTVLSLERVGPVQPPGQKLAVFNACNLVVGASLARLTAAYLGGFKLRHGRKLKPPRLKNETGPSYYTDFPLT
jgi:hypothetical protein